MGLQLKVDLETNLGPTQEAYIRIDSFRVNRSLAEVKYTTTCWLNKHHADSFLRLYFDEDNKNANGLVSANVLYFDKEDSDGREIHIENFYQTTLTVEKEITVPVYEDKTFTKEEPYISFDEDGNEITIMKTIEEVKPVQIGKRVEKKQVIDYSIISRIEDFCYDHLTKELSKLFTVDKIIKV